MSLHYKIIKMLLHKIIIYIFLNEQNIREDIISLQSADEQNYTEGIINVYNKRIQLLD